MKKLIFIIACLLILSVNIYSEELAKPFDFRNYQFLAAPAPSESKSDSDDPYSKSNYGDAHHDDGYHDDDHHDDDHHDDHGSGGFIESLKELRITGIVALLCSILIIIVSRIGAAYNKRYEIIIEEPEHH